MKRKIIKYLNTKEEKDYNHLDRIFKFNLDGNLRSVLSKYGFSKIEIFPERLKKGNLLQIYCWYYNLVICIEFDDDCFEYAINLPGISAEQFDKSFIKCDYTESFNIEKFIDNFHVELTKDSRLNRNQDIWEW